jgi:Flp pilus assembly protein TadG
MRLMRVRRPRTQRGQSLVEFALILPVIVMIVFGLFDLGRGVFAFNTVAQAARQATRMRPHSG